MYRILSGIDIRDNWKRIANIQPLILVIVNAWSIGYYSSTTFTSPALGFNEYRIIARYSLCLIYSVYLWCYRRSQEDCAPQKIHSRLLQSIIRFSFLRQINFSLLSLKRVFLTNTACGSMFPNILYRYVGHIHFLFNSFSFAHKNWKPITPALPLSLYLKSIFAWALAVSSVTYDQSNSAKESRKNHQTFCAVTRCICIRFHTHIKYIKYLSRKIQHRFVRLKCKKYIKTVF